MLKKVLVILVLFLHVPMLAQKSLSILFVVQQYPAMDTFVVNQAIGLANMGHSISVLAFKQKTDDAPCELPAGMIKEVFYGRSVPKNVQHDIILCQFLPLARLGLELIDAGHRGKLVVLVRGGSDNLLEVVTEYSRMFHTQLRQCADLMLPMCQFFQKQLVQLGYPEHKIKLLYSGVDLTQFTYAHRSFAAGQTIELLSIGHLIERKGFEYAIRAVAHLSKTYPIHYTIIGKGPLHNQLQALIRQLGAERHITLAGTKKHAEVAAYLSTAHIFLAPSVLANGYGETIPTVLREAMACGKPVIATNHCGIPELVSDYRSGLLVPERDTQALASRIEWLIKSPHRWAALGSAARAAVEEKHGLVSEIQHLNDMLCALT